MDFKDSSSGLLDKLYQKMGFALPAPADQALADPLEHCLGCLAEVIHAASMVGLAMLRHKNNHVQSLCESAEKILQDPSVENHVKFQTLLFTTYRDVYGHIFPVHLLGKDVLPLYLRKYLQVLEELAQISKIPAHSRKSAGVEQSVLEGMTFLVNNWTGTVAVLRPLPGTLDGPSIEALPGTLPPPAPLKSVPSQVTPGLYLLSPASQPVPLHPFYYLSSEGPSILRMLTSDGAFYRRLGKEGYNLLYAGDLLLDLGEFLFKIGAYSKALNIYRLVEQENRQAMVLVSGLHHCLNAKELSSRGEALKASAEWDLCLSVKQDLPILYHELARDYLAAGRHTQATATINRLLERFPTSDEGFVTLGDIYSARGDYGRAQRAYEKALLLNSHHPTAGQKRQDAQKKLESKTSGQASEEKGESLPGDLLYSLTFELQKKPRVKLLGREEALSQLLEVLSCKDKKNALLVGEAGVGKTALVEELARRLHERGIPESLQKKNITALNLGAMIAGARYRGQFEERVLEVVRKLKERSDLVLIENLHHLVTTGTTRGGSLDSASLLKPALLRGEIQVLGTTDEESFGNILEKDPSFLKLFHIIKVAELDIEVVKSVVAERRGDYEGFHGIVFPPGLVENCLNLVRLSIVSRSLPESALDLMDRAGARVSLETHSAGRDGVEVTRDDLLRTLSEMSGISYERLALLERERLDKMEDLLSSRVIDQEEAVSKVSRVVRAAKLGMDLDPRRPDGVFLFVGPTGVGKTALGRALAGLLFGDEEKLIRIDMSEYMDRISTSRLIGTAPGYVGYYDQNQLTDQVRKNPYCVILFDEVEKADPQVLNLFLQIFDAGRLTDGKGRTVRFNHATVIMTSNLGAHLFSKARVGYRDQDRQPVEEEEVIKEVRTFFTPEFLNRVDEVVVFKNLSEDSLCKIIDLQLADLGDRIRQEGKRLSLHPEARAFLAREGYSFEYGARNLGRVLRRQVSEPLSRLALTPEWERSDRIDVSLSRNAIQVKLSSGGASELEDPGSLKEMPADLSERESEGSESS